MPEFSAGAFGVPPCYGLTTVPDPDVPEHEIHAVWATLPPNDEGILARWEMRVNPTTLEKFPDMENEWKKSLMEEMSQF